MIGIFRSKAWNQWIIRAFSLNIFFIFVWFASLTMFNGIKYFFWFHLKKSFLVFKEEIERKVLLTHIKCALFRIWYFDYKGSFSSLHFLDKHSWYIFSDCILSNCFNNKNGLSCCGLAVFFIGLEWSVGLLLVYFFLILQFMYIKRMKKIRLNEKQLDVHEIIFYYFSLLDVKVFKKMSNIKYWYYDII